MTYALPDFLFSTLRACIHFVPSQILAIDTFDADRKYPEGPTCPDSFVVGRNSPESADSGECLHETKLSLILFSSGVLRRRYYDCPMSEDRAAIEANLASQGVFSIAVSGPFSRILPCS